MTAREMYEAALTEMNKVEAPSLLLEDYNYFINKAVQQYINKVYNRYDINQQSSDDLRVLKSTAEVKLERNYPTRITSEIERKVASKKKFIYTGTLPSDYMHILNCVVDYDVLKPFKCYNEGDSIAFAAKRLTADLAVAILHNAYMKPDYKRPYFYINNINNNTDVSLSNSNLVYAEVEKNQDGSYSIKQDSVAKLGSTDTVLDSSIIGSTDRDSTNPVHNRISNISPVNIEIRFGDDDSIFQPTYCYIDYIKSPMFIRLTYDQITSTEDSSQVLEWPDYICFEIVNEFVKLLMENASDPRLQTNFAINQTIANPIQQQQSQSAGGQS